LPRLSEQKEEATFASDTPENFKLYIFANI
jgi:hypothetical protein